MHSGPGISHSAMRRTARVALAAVAAWLVIAVLGESSAASQTPQTIVSLTFDDGTATQFQADQMLADHGMDGTFYINSSRIGANDYYMTWGQLERLARHGNEIGGHTAHHANLPLTDATEARRQICLDRVNLLSQGFDAKNFAYPHGANNASVREMAQSCGYNSARSTSSAVAESIPPQDPYAIRVGTGSGDLAVLKNAVMQAEQSGGGWVPIVFHQICNACDSNWIRTVDFKAFLDWLQPRAGNGTVVRTVDEVIGGPLQAAVQPPPPPPAPNGFNALKNASLETDSNGDLTPDCWQFDGYGDHSFDWTRTSDAHTGSWAERVEIANHQTGDAKLVPVYDLGFCTPTVLAGHRYRLSAWYKSTTPVSFTTFARGSLGGFSFFESSPEFPPASTWTRVTWDTPVIPDGVSGMTFGLGLSSNGTLTVDDLGIDDAAPTGSADTTPPVVSLTAPSANSTVAGIVPLTATATDNVGIDRVDFLVDGAVVGSSSTQPYTLNWNARSVPNGTHTIGARAVDTSTNTATTASIRVMVANSTTNLLQNPSLEAGSASTPACWQLGGFGMNTFAWARTSDAHTGSFAQKLDVTSLSTGDRKLVVALDAGACAISAIVGRSYSVSAWYKSPSDPNPTGTQASIYAYYRNSAGGWVYWSQSPRLPASSTWAQAIWNTPALPVGATHISIGLGLNTVGTVTMDDFSLSDNAPLPDTTAPTSEITCNDEAGHGDEASGDEESHGCIDGYYRESVEVRLTAVDNEFGSGVASVRYTTDGSEPTATNGTTYGGAFSVPAPGATVKWRAYDKAGNAEPVRSEVIRIDPIAPASSIKCNGASCLSGPYSDAVSVSLEAADTGGSGVREIRYTTDGSEPTASSGNSYLGAFSVSGTKTVNYRAFDHAGNAEPVKTQTIQIENGAPTDGIAPTSSISCGGSACTSGYSNTPVSVSLAASDEGGSGVDEIRYTTDGTEPTASNGTAYTSPFALGSTTTVKYRAFDNAGNAEPVNSALIRVDTTAPATAIACNGGSCSGHFQPSVSVSLDSSDADSGVASIRYTTDGSDPTATNGTVYSAPFSLSVTRTVRYRAFDNVGNAEPVATRQVQVDGAAPSVTVTNLNAGDFVEGTATLTANAADDAGVARVDFLVDGQPVGASSTAPYSFAWNSQLVSDGTHSVSARAIDTAGNSKTSTAVSVMVANNNLLRNPSLETPAGSGASCWTRGGYGTNVFTWNRTSDAHSGSFAELLSITSLTTGDRKLVSAQDTGACAPGGIAGKTYTVTAWYKSTDRPTVFAYYRNSAGTWTYWSQSPRLDPSTAWVRRTWTTPPLPSGATAISVGLGLLSTGSVTMDDFGLFANG